MGISSEAYGHAPSLIAGTSSVSRAGLGWALEGDQNCKSLHTCTTNVALRGERCAEEPNRWRTLVTQMTWNRQLAPMTITAAEQRPEGDKHQCGISHLSSKHQFCSKVGYRGPPLFCATTPPPHETVLR